MTPLVVSGAVALVVLGAAPLLCAVSGVGSRAAVTGSGGRLGADGLRAAAAFTALALAIGGLDGDILVTGALAAAALGRRRPAAALTLVLAAAAVALRVGSSALADIGGAHAVLGPAVASPAAGVVISSALAAGAMVLVAMALMPQLPRGGGALPVLGPGPAADATVPALAALLAVAALFGPPLVAGEAADWAVVRFVAVAAILVVAAVGRRLVRRVDPDRVLVVAAAGAVLSVALAVASA